tara:strand:- start:621 stop:809 length:189 start_codon:yes stop_codon:yes gene_type:complete
MIEELVTKLLDDDHGISEEAFGELILYLDHIGENQLLQRITNEVQACEGRFYFPLPTFFEDE